MLAGLRVLELASVLAGPSVGQFLAELGADVIKVENRRTNGDVTRGWRLPGESKERGSPSAYYRCCNLGKRSLALDAACPQGRELCRSLAKASDVVLASYKPGDAEKLGLDAASLRAECPRMVYAQITGYGLEDPRVGYDALIQAEAGFTFMNGEPGEAGRPTKMPVALVDLLAAHQLKEAILLALWRRDRTGEGAHVHVSLMAAAVASLANQATGYICAGKIPQRMGSDHPAICPYGTAFEDRGGQPLILAVGADSQFRVLCEVLGCPDVAEDPRFTTNVARVKHRAELTKLLTTRIRIWDRDVLLEELRARKVPAGAVADMAAVFQTPQARGLVVQDAASGRDLGMRQVAWLEEDVGAEGAGGAPAAAASLQLDAPRYGEHSAEVLKEVLGLSVTEITQLTEEGIIE